MALSKEQCDSWDLHSLPMPFLDELRRAVDAGLTPTQVSSVVELSLMVYGMMDMFDQPADLSQRVKRITESMDRVAKAQAAQTRLRRLAQSP